MTSLGSRQRDLLARAEAAGEALYVPLAHTREVARSLARRALMRPVMTAGRESGYWSITCEGRRALREPGGCRTDD